MYTDSEYSEYIMLLRLRQTAYVEPHEEPSHQSASTEHERRPQQGAGALSDRQCIH